jgi:hypothetical protein
MTVAAAAGRAAAQKGAASGAAKATPKRKPPTKRKTTSKPRARKAPVSAGDDLVASGTSTTGEPLPYSGEKKAPENPAPAEAGKQNSKPAEAGSGKRGLSMPQLPQSGVLHDGSWAILGFLAWGWVVMPFLEGGLPGMKKVLLAKFFNKKPDGSYY